MTTSISAVQQLQKSISVLPITQAGQPREVLATSIMDSLRSILHETQGNLPPGLKSALIAALPLLEGPAGSEIKALRGTFPEAFHDPIAASRIVRSSPGDHALAPTLRSKDFQLPEASLTEHLLAAEKLRG